MRKVEASESILIIFFIMGISPQVFKMIVALKWDKISDKRRIEG